MAAVSSSSGRAPPPPPPSHTAYILGQVRSGLAHLRATQAMDRSTFDQVNQLLANVSLHETEGVAHRDTAEPETEEERLGKRNAWLRDAMSETSLLPTLVETAMQIAVPSALLGDMQREAIVALVERSQKSIARAITDPKTQQKAQGGAWTTAKGAHSGVVRGWQAAGQGIQDMAKRRQESKQKSEEKRKERDEKKALKKELKREREAIIRQRQAAMLENGDEAAAEDAKKEKDDTSDASKTKQFVRSPSVLTAASASKQPSVSGGETSRGTNLSSVAGKLREMDHGEDSDDDTDDSDGDDEPALSTEGGAMASVSCARVDEEESCVTATTTFSPWPGLVLSSTIVALADEAIPSSKDINRIRHDQAMAMSSQGSTSSGVPGVPPPRRIVAPAPPPPNVPVQKSTDASQTSLPTGTTASSSSSSKSHDVEPLRQQLRDLPRTPSNAPVASATGPDYANLPPPPLPSQMPPSIPMQSSSPAQSHRPPPPRGPSSYQPAHPDHPTSTTSSSSTPQYQSPTPQQHTQHHPPPARTEVKDVTDSKQKGWSRKFGL